jgi:NAD-dependent histone deacetylase SIR2
MSSEQDVKSGFRRIVVLTGAGISKAAGFPTFHDRDSVNVKCLENIYDVIHKRMRENPEPTAAHQLLSLLYKKGYIKRIYTQNIDDLHEKSGIPSDTVVHFHGTMENITRFGEPIDPNVLKMVEKDFVLDCDIDCVLVMGTRLSVSPFNALPNLVPCTCFRILVNLDPIESNRRIVDAGLVFGNSCPVRFGKRLVTTRQSWNHSKSTKWRRNQRIIYADVQKWARELIDNNLENLFGISFS